ncbi:MAG: helix-turn-helix transcriptional regulator [SAR324 cluster bacterium]|nr:helix-turn-helix transcriptional regulator [SAR324 cluster bacterium]
MEKTVSKLREAMNISQQELARKANTSQAVISRIENGSISMGLQMLHKIATALDRRVQITFQ